MAMAQQGRHADALEQFNQVLERSPTNALALKYVQSLMGDEKQGSTGE